RELTDIRCLEPMLDGAHVRDVHGVVGTGYRGETIYSWDAAAARVSFTYYNILGEAMSGFLTPVEGGFVGHGNRRLEDGTEHALRVEVQFTGDGFVQRGFEDGRLTALIAFERRSPDAFPELYGVGETGTE
ncbi:MAG: hypothetical protein LC634_09060, partial [Sphingomonadales bacterium]|nr:hypothetical protein [Sphingomonadales bacterium]